MFYSNIYILTQVNCTHLYIKTESKYFFELLYVYEKFNISYILGEEVAKYTIENPTGYPYLIKKKNIRNAGCQNPYPVHPYCKFLKNVSLSKRENNLTSLFSCVLNA